MKKRTMSLLLVFIVVAHGLRSAQPVAHHQKKKTREPVQVTAAAPISPVIYWVGVSGAVVCAVLVLGMVAVHVLGPQGVEMNRHAQVTERYFDPDIKVCCQTVLCQLKTQWVHSLLTYDVERGDAAAAVKKKKKTTKKNTRKVLRQPPYEVRDDGIINAQGTDDTETPNVIYVQPQTVLAFHVCTTEGPVVLLDEKKEKTQVAPSKGWGVKYGLFVAGVVPTDANYRLVQLRKDNQLVTLVQVVATTDADKCTKTDGEFNTRLWIAEAKKTK